MVRVFTVNDPSDHIFVSFHYHPLFVAKLKAIDGRRWHPTEKHWSLRNASNPPHGWGREREGVKKLESGLSAKFDASSKTTEIHTHVSPKSIGKIESPLGNLDLNRGGDA